MPVKRMGAGRIQKLKEHDDRIEQVAGEVAEIKKHIILKDGSYSNTTSVEMVVRMRAGEIKQFEFGQGPYKRRWRVVDIDRFGIWVEPMGGPHRDLAECSFFKWVELEEGVIKPL